VKRTLQARWLLLVVGMLALAGSACSLGGEGGVDSVIAPKMTPAAAPTATPASAPTATPADAGGEATPAGPPATLKVINQSASIGVCWIGVEGYVGSPVSVMIPPGAEMEIPDIPGGVYDLSAIACDESRTWEQAGADLSTYYEWVLMD